MDTEGGEAQLEEQEFAKALGLRQELFILRMGSSVSARALLSAVSAASREVFAAPVPGGMPSMKPASWNSGGAARDTPSQKP